MELVVVGICVAALLGLYLAGSGQRWAKWQAQKDLEQRARASQWKALGRNHPTRFTAREEHEGSHLTGSSGAGY